MAEGGGEFGYEEPGVDNRLDHDSDEGEQEVDTTRPFRQGAASTPYQPGDPYHGGEQMEMSTFPHEQSGPPDTSYQEETPLLGAFIHHDDEKVMIEKGWENIKKVYPDANRAKLGPIKLGQEKGNQTSLVVKPANKEYRIFKKDGVTLQKSFIKLKEPALGRKANVIIVEDRDTIREMKQRLVEAENQQQQAETLYSQRQEEKRKVEDLRRKIEQTNAKIDVFQDEHGSNLESEAELLRLKELKKNYQTDLENKKKELDSLTKKNKKQRKGTSQG